MSEYKNALVGKAIRSLDVSPQFDGYSGVEIVVSEDTAYFEGNRTGRVLQIHNQWGTQAQAQYILNKIRGFQYQPFRAEDAIIDPAAELGDGVTVSEIYSGIYLLSKKYGPMMLSAVEAPQDKELDHEYPFEPKQDRIYRRELAQQQAQIRITQQDIAAEVSRASAAEGTLNTKVTQTADAIRSEVTRATQAEGTLNTKVTQTASAITSEVTRATKAEGTLRSSITQNANSIAAKVSKSGGSSASFGWTLTDNSWTLTSGNTTVFKATSAGIEVRGKITAISGFIGNGNNGFTISAKALYNGMTSLADTEKNGVYIGTDGIALGKGAFKVTSAGAVTAKNLAITGGTITIGDNFKVDNRGNVTANNMKLAGTLNVGGEAISAAALRQGAQRANSGYSGWNSTSTTVGNNSGYWGSGGVAGAKFDNMANQTGAYPINASSFRVNGIQYSPRDITVSDSFGTRTFRGVLMYSVE